MGLPISVAFLGEAGIAFAFSFMAAALDEDSLTVQNIAAIFMTLMLVPVEGIFFSLSNLVSGAMGSKRWDDIRRYTFANLVFISVTPTIIILWILRFLKKWWVCL